MPFEALFASESERLISDVCGLVASLGGLAARAPRRGGLGVGGAGGDQEAEGQHGGREGVTER